MIKASEIPRTKLAVCSVDAQVVTLAEEASTLLGYSALKEEVEGTADTSGPLRRALAKLDIQPLDMRAVKQYQFDLRREAEARQFEEQLRTRGPENIFAYASWNDTKIERYREPIPEFVLNKAVQLKRECPEVTFTVEHLDENPDPFLIAKLKDEKFYIEVWEEPRFEGRIKS